MSVVIETTVGDLTVDLFIKDRPLACLNFIKLCKLKYYNYNLFHTIEQDFIAQTGDPTGAGDGGTSVWGVIEGPLKRFFEAESLPKLHHTSVGLLSFVSPGKHLVGSQFYFTLGADLTSLDGQHCVIGEVVEGHETLRRLNETIVDDKFRPYQDIRITHTVILEDPFPDMRGFRAPSRSPSPTPQRLQNGRIAADEDIDDTEGKTMEEVQEMLAEREAKARATILEIVGDLPDAEAAPPENVLFVCKLNPVTTEDDLEIIFSRFGNVVNCEVIRDKKTGDSLQYAFVEFDNEKSCEAAYFKMNNVLIDDRRIHVDFSQSVARVKWRGKGRGVEGPQGRLDFRNLREADKSTKSDAEERRRAREQRHRDQERNTKRSPDRRRENETNDREKNGKSNYQAREIKRRHNSSHRESGATRNEEKSFADRKTKEYTPERNRRQKSLENEHRQEEKNKRRRESPRRVDSSDNYRGRDRRRERASPNRYQRRCPERSHRRESSVRRSVSAIPQTSKRRERIESTECTKSRQSRRDRSASIESKALRSSKTKQKRSLSRSSNYEKKKKSNRHTSDESSSSDTDSSSIDRKKRHKKMKKHKKKSIKQKKSKK